MGVDLATLETVGEGVAEATLTLAGLAFPEALPFIAIAKEAIPALIAARPYILKAVQDGESAFHAANVASPGLGAKIEAMAKRIPMAAGVSDWASHLDNVTAVGAHAMYVQNLHDSGYDPANDFDANGNMKVSG